MKCNSSSYCTVCVACPWTVRCSSAFQLPERLGKSSQTQGCSPPAKPFIECFFGRCRGRARKLVHLISQRATTKLQPTNCTVLHVLLAKFPSSNAACSCPPEGPALTILSRKKKKSERRNAFLPCCLSGGKSYMFLH